MVGLQGLKPDVFADQGNKGQVHAVIVKPQSSNPNLAMTNHFYLQLDSPDVCRIQTEAGLHVGNFKRIGNVWKFKAIGYDDTGQVIPGGGPLTDKHNTALSQLDEIEIDRVLGS